MDVSEQPDVYGLALNSETSFGVVLGMITERYTINP